MTPTLPRLFLPVLLLTGCHSITPHLDRWAGTGVTRCAVILPGTRADSPALADWRRRRERQGIEVSLVPFRADADLEARAQDVREGLQTLLPATGGHSYALILADQAALPMGPWLVDGLDRTVESDLPWFFESAPVPEDTWIQASQWQAGFAEDFPWVVGRIPSLDEAVWEAALSPDETRDTGSPLALLGSERYLLWGDTAWIMARVRSVLLARGWRALSLSEDWPGDLRLGALEAADRARMDACLDEVCLACGGAAAEGCTFTSECLVGAWHPERLMFLAAWQHLSPDVVYLNSHGGSMFGTTVGDWLLSEQRLEQLEVALRARDLPLAPAHPALLIVGACQAGSAGDTLIPRLLQGGWASAVIASTENTDPTPLLAALQSEVDVARTLRPDLSTGLALRACLESYLCDARSSLGWWLRRGTAPLAARNVLGISLFGDPTRPVLAIPDYNQRP